MTDRHPFVSSGTPAGMDATAHHVGITVRDLDRTVEFYRDALGLTVVDRFAVEGEAFADAVDVAGASGRFAHLAASEGDTRVELVEYDSEGEPVDEPTLNRPGAAHVGLAVPDVDAAFEELPEDAETLSEPRTTGSGTRILFVRDPEGNLVELLDA